MTTFIVCSPKCSGVDAKLAREVRKDINRLVEKKYHLSLFLVNIFFSGVFLNLSKQAK